MPAVRNGRRGKPRGSRNWARSAGRVAGGLAQGLWKNRKLIVRGAKKLVRGSTKRTKVTHQRIRQDGTGTSRSINKFGHPRDPKLSTLIKKMKAPQYYDFLGNQAFDTLTSGVQKANNVGFFFDSTVLTLLWNEASAAVASPTAGPMFPAIGTQQKAYKMYLESVQAYATFTNGTNANMTIDIYDLIARHDRSTLADPITDWNTGTNIQEQGGLITVPPNNSSSVPYQMPQNSRVFNQFWKIKKVTHVELAQGRSHEHIMTFSPNRVFDYTRASQSAVVGGLTCYMMVVIRGFPAFKVGDNTVVTLTQAACPCVLRAQYKTRYIETVPTIYARSGSLSTTAAAVLSEGSGVPSPFAEAI